MKTAQQWLDAYGASHQNPTNKTIHWICIPLIMISLLGLLASIPSPFESPWLSWPMVLLVFAVVYYAMLSRPLAVGMVAVSVVMLAAVHALAILPVPLWLSSTAIFVGAWIVQFIGHKIEGAKPSFFEDLQFLLIGPMWLLAHLYKRAGISY